MALDDNDVIYLDSICKDPFWNSTLTLNSSWPKFTHCFQYTALSWPAPSVFLLVFLVQMAGQLLTTSPGPRRAQANNFKWTPLFCCRMLGCVFLFGLTMLELVHNELNMDDEKMSAFVVVISKLLRMTAFLCAASLLILDRSRGRITSGPLFIFWVLFTATETFRMYERTMEKMYDTDIENYIIDAIVASLIFIEFILSFVTDTTSRDSDVKDTQSSKKHWPEEQASYPSQLFFSWLIELIYKSWRGLLSDDDIHLLPQDLECSHLKVSFSHVWRKVFTKDKRKLNKKESRKRKGTPDIIHAFNNGDVSSNHVSNGGPSSKAGGGNKKDNKEKAEKEKLPRSLIKTLFNLHGVSYSYAFGQKVLSDSLLVIQPIIAKEIIEFASKPSEERQLWVGVLLCSVLLLTQMARTTLHNSSLYVGGLLGLKMKSALTSAIFQKAMTMSAEARKMFSMGDLVTLMSVDCLRIQEIWRIVVLIAGSPLQLIAAGVLLYYTLGVSALIAIGVLVLFVPLNVYLARKMRQVQSANMKLKSKRIKLIADVLNGIKVLKLYAWEDSFQAKITAIRDQEIQNMRTLYYVKILFMTNVMMSPYLVTLAAFCSYVLLNDDNYLDPATAFVSITYFNIMRTPLIMMTYVLTVVVMSMVSIERVNRLLYGEDLEKYVGDNPSPGNAISVSEGTFTWDEDGLRILYNMDVKENSLTMLVGKVGNGKSSLLSAILGEMRIVTGTVNLKGSIAYVAQKAWIQNATVRDNILFGQAMDKARYRSIIKACALEPDLRILTSGDLTEIGEKGINLSGGQKQRIALARALYQDQDIYILDDPLSAVDSHVGKHIFKHVISNEGLLKGKTRLLVTHGAQWLPHGDKVVMMEDGSVTHSGTFDELMAHDNGFAQLLTQQGKEENEEAGKDETREVDESSLDLEKDDDTDDGVMDIESVEEKSDGKSQTRSPNSSKMEFEMKPLRKRATQNNGDVEKGKMDDAKNKKDGGRMTEDEVMQTGQVKWTVTFSWIKAGSVVMMLAALLIMAAFRGVYLFDMFVLKFWTGDSFLSNETNRNTSEFDEKNYFYLGLYGGIGGAQVVLFMMGLLAFWRSAMVSANRLHQGMLSSIMRTPMAFFDTTPMGRLLNRFSGDINIVDDNYPTVLNDIITCGYQILGTILVVCISYPYFSIAMVPILLLFYLLEVFYLPAARQVKRMESVSKSPIYSHFGEALEGVSTIRAFGHVGRFLRESAHKVDFSVVRTLIIYGCNSWLNICLDTLGVIFVVTTSMFVVLSPFTDGATAGLCISYALEFSIFLVFMVRQQADFTADSVAVERIMEYSKLPSEAMTHIPRDGAPSQWPKAGRIEFKDLKMRYRPGLDLVLKGISTIIEPGEKVAIVGRTGAGKSSLTIALFRLVEAAGGAVYIDGVDISKVGLHKLRSRISILPQDPVLFAGSLRMNVDPHEDHTDQQVQEALARAHLAEFVSSLPDGLAHDVGEEGKNLSVGQRQLVCLARALLRRSAILVLDEATAAVDVETDSYIQETIRTAFKDCTVLAIAHRLNTVMDYDRIIVLDNGRIAETGNPSRLMANPDSLFYAMAKQSNLVSASSEADENHKL